MKKSSPMTPNKRTRVTEGNTSYNRKGGALKSVTKTVTNNGYRVTTNVTNGKTRKVKI